MDFALAVAPIAFLVVALTKARPWPAHVAMPAAALLAVGLAATWFGRRPSLLGAQALLGLLEALTPITIVGGAVLLFKTLEESGAMDVIRRALARVSPDPVAQWMTIGWAFAFLIEGASGFGTPAALAAPLLVGLGFPPARAALGTLMLNSVPVSFGAVGTPTWFGLGTLGLDPATVLTLGIRTAVLHTLAALWIVPVALGLVVGFRAVLRRAPFVLASTLASTVPYALSATVSYEFPALVGGAIGLLVTALLAVKGIGLGSLPERDATVAPEHAADAAVERGIGGGPTDAAVAPSAKDIARATFPLTATVALLVLTRIPQLGIRPLLVAEDPRAVLDLGWFGELSVSAALVVSLEGVLGAPGADGAWSYRTLYVPALIPFVVVCLASFRLFRLDGATTRRIVAESAARLRHPVLALLGALVLVRVLMGGGDHALVQVIGAGFADAAGRHWPWFAPYLGALGSFFSGSATISNLTFGGIQASIADALRVDRATLLALQSVGAAMGNMVCVHNIVAVCSILGLHAHEGFVLKRTVGPMVAYGLVAVVAARLLYGF